MRTQIDALNEINKHLRIINNTLCCASGTGGGGGTFDGHIVSTCLDPVHTSLCEMPTLLNKLQDLQDHIDDISVHVDNVNITADQIDLDVTDLETLVTSSNTLLTNILTQVQRGASCGNQQFVEVCNQISLTSTNNLLGNILTQVTAVNTNTDTLETLIAATNTALGTLTTINTLLTNIKSDTASIVTNTAATNTALTVANTSLDNIEAYTKTLDDLRATYQPLDCNGDPYGGLIDVLPIIVSNPVNSTICNVDSLAAAIATAIIFPTLGQYNTVTQNEYTTGTTTISANTVHSISYMVLTGTCVVSINGNPSTYTAGESSEEEATGLIGVTYSFAPGASSKVRVKTIKV